MFCWAPILVASPLPKWEVNRGSLSVMTFFGSPNHGYTFLRYKAAMPSPVIVVEHGRNRAAREHPWSTIVRMASFPLILGRPVIRSIAICWNGRESSRVVIWYKGILGRCVRFLFCWHVAHPAT